MMKKFGMGMELQNLRAVDNVPYLKVSKVIYEDSVKRINAYYNDQKDWIESYAYDQAAENIALDHWKKDAMFTINHSEVGPAARV